MHYEAFGERLIVRRDKPRETIGSSGLLILPPKSVAKAQERVEQGTIVHIGERVRQDLKAGDRVLFNAYNAEPLDRSKDLQTCVVMADTVLAVIEPEIESCDSPVVCDYCGDRLESEGERLECPHCERAGCPGCMPAGRGCVCPQCEGVESLQ